MRSAFELGGPESIDTETGLGLCGPVQAASCAHVLVGGNDGISVAEFLGPVHSLYDIICPDTASQPDVFAPSLKMCEDHPY